MAANYNLSLPTRLDQARFLFHDTAGATVDSLVVTKPLLQDEEYLGAMRAWGETEGLAKAAIALASNFEQKVKSYANTRGGTSVDWPERGEFYLKLAADIRLNGIGEVINIALAGLPPLPLPYPSFNSDGSIRPADERLLFL